MSNYKDLSSEELKRTLAEKQDILRRTMKPDEYKKFMQELDDCQIKIDYSKFGKPVQYPETKKEKRQRKKEEQILSTRDAGEQFSTRILAFLSVYVDEESCSFLAVLSPERTKIMKKKAAVQRNVGQFTKKEWKAMGTRIREVRKKANMKQIDLAALLGLGKDQMCRIENGKTPCKTEYLFEIAQIFNVSLDYLYFGENEYSAVQEIVKMCKGKGLKKIRKAKDILEAFFK